MHERFLNLPQLKERGITYHTDHLGRLERAGKFPRRRVLSGGGRVGWLESEIDSYLADLPLGGAAGRDRPLPPPGGRWRGKVSEVEAIEEEVPPGMLRCEACSALFERKRGRPPRRCPECRA